MLRYVIFEHNIALRCCKKWRREQFFLDAFHNAVVDS